MLEPAADYRQLAGGDNQLFAGKTEGVSDTLASYAIDENFHIQDVIESRRSAVITRGGNTRPADLDVALLRHDRQP